MKKIITLIGSYIFVLLSTPTSILAAETFRIGPPSGSGYGVPVNGTADNALQTVLNNGLRIIYTIGALGVLIYFIWGAVDWIFAGGDKEKIANARKRMTQSLIGLALLALSGVIITTVGNILNFNPLKVLYIPGLGDATSGTGAPPAPQSNPRP